MLHPRHIKKPEPVTYFGQTDSRGRRTPFGIKSADRSRHMYVIGKTGMGKSTLLENMAIQDIKNGHGICFVDPHGKTADLLLDYVPAERLKDVLYLAPFDMDYPVSFNIMEDVGADKRHLVVNGLMATFEKIWVDAWSARMAYILQNTLLALLEYPGSTLLGVNRMLVDKEYRKLVVNNVTDPSVRSFWVDEFAKYTDRYTQEATPAIQNKVGQFASNPLIRNIIGQSKSTFDLRQLMDTSKIIIVNLSKGKVGEGNANLLGSMFITKIYLAAMSRADVSETELQKLPNFYLYVDEFQSFANKSFADILSEARKYKLNLTLAHQYIEQMEEEVSAAVFGNVGTLAVFRVGAFDAEFLEKEFAPYLLAEDLVNLGIYQIYLKLMIDGVTSAPFSAITIPPIERPAQSFKDQVIEYSRATFARPRTLVEREIIDWHAPIVPAPKERRNGGGDDARESSPQRPHGDPRGHGRDERVERRDVRTEAPGRPSRNEAHAGEPERPSQGETRAGEHNRAPHGEQQKSEPERLSRGEIKAIEPIRISEPVRISAPGHSDTLPHRERHDTLPHEINPASPHHSLTHQPVSLSSLRPGSKKDKPSDAHLSELRRALSDVLQQTEKNAPEISQSQPQPQPPHSHTQQPTQQRQQQHSSQHPNTSSQHVQHSRTEQQGSGYGTSRLPADSSHGGQTSEIPEHLLRKLLTVEPPAEKEKKDNQTPPPPPAPPPPPIHPSPDFQS